MSFPFAPGFANVTLWRKEILSFSSMIGLGNAKTVKNLHIYNGTIIKFKDSAIVSDNSYYDGFCLVSLSDT